MCQLDVLWGNGSLTKPQYPLIQQINNDQSIPINLIGYQHAIKTFKRFLYTNITPINNILSRVHNKIQTFGVFQTTWCFFSNFHSRSINQIFDRIFLNFNLSFPTSHPTTYPPKYILSIKTKLFPPSQPGRTSSSELPLNLREISSMQTSSEKSSSSFCHQIIFRGFQPFHQSYYHPYHACHIKYLHQVEGCLPAQLR